MPATHISGKDELQTVLSKAGSKLVVVDFMAKWCGPCQTIAPFVDSLSDKYAANTEFLKADVNQCADLATSKNVMTLPTFLFFKNGKEIYRFRGSDTAHLENKVVELTGSSPTVGGTSQSKAVKPGQEGGLSGLVAGFLQAALPDSNTNPSNSNGGNKAFVGQGLRLGDKASEGEETDTKTSLPVVAPARGGWFSGWFKKTPSEALLDIQDAQALMKVDDALPTTEVRVRLADGSKLDVKLNLTQSISKIRDFILASRPDQATKEFVLMTLAPNTVITDESASISEAKLEHSVIQQKFS